MFRIAGLGENVARTETGIALRTLQSWKKEESFKQVEIAIPLWRSRFQLEAIKQLREDNKALGVIIERRALVRLADELETGDYILLKTRFGRDVYKNLMSLAGTVEHTGSWPQILAGVLNVQTSNSEAESSSTAQRIKSYANKDYPQQSFDCEAEIISERFDDAEGV